MLVLEGARTRSAAARARAELTLPGFRHDVCSACHPMGILSPFFRTLPLEQHGLQWVKPAVSVAHPLEGQPAVLLRGSVGDTAAGLGDDARAYARLIDPLLAHPHELLADVLSPLRFPKHPLRMLRFGSDRRDPRRGLARGRFRGDERARALFAGCAAHSILPLERALTAAVGMVFCMTAHVEPWPVAKGGSAAITAALASAPRSRSAAACETGAWVRSMADLPPARVVLFDTSARAARRDRRGRACLGLRAASRQVPLRPRRLQDRLGPGRSRSRGRIRTSARPSTVHVGGTLDEIAAGEAAVWRGEHPERPFVLVVQQSMIDPTRAPAGKHTGYAYCHVPAGSTVDLTETVERQIERFAPGFRDRVLARHTMTAADFESYNPTLAGGAITGGVADLGQLFTRPLARWNPYSTPNPRLFLCSSSTPPGGGVHGMPGYFAARAAMKRLR